MTTVGFAVESQGFQGPEDSMSLQSLVEEMGEIADPRSTHKVEHLLIDILVIAVCAVIAGAEI